jgi:hypothetical protein
VEALFYSSYPDASFKIRFIYYISKAAKEKTSTATDSKLSVFYVIISNLYRVRPLKAPIQPAEKEVQDTGMPRPVNLKNERVSRRGEVPSPPTTTPKSEGYRGLTETI